MEETKHLLKQVRVLVVVLAVLLLGSQIQLQLRNRDIGKLRATVADIQSVQGDAKAAAVDAKAAASKASKDLTAAIEASQESGTDPKAVAELFENVRLIRQIIENLDSYIRNTGGTD